MAHSMWKEKWGERYLNHQSLGLAVEAIAELEALQAKDQLPIMYAVDRYVLACGRSLHSQHQRRALGLFVRLARLGAVPVRGTQISTGDEVDIPRDFFHGASALTINSVNETSPCLIKGGTVHFSCLTVPAGSINTIIACRLRKYRLPGADHSKHRKRGRKRSEIYDMTVSFLEHAIQQNTKRLGKPSGALSAEVRKYTPSYKSYASQIDTTNTKCQPYGKSGYSELARATVRKMLLQKTG